MEESRIDRLERAVIFLILGLLPLHLYLSFSNLVNGIDKGHGHSFPMGSYVLIGVYLMIVLASDVFMLRYGKFEASRALRRCCPCAVSVSVRPGERRDYAAMPALLTLCGAGPAAGITGGGGGEELRSVQPCRRGGLLSGQLGDLPVCGER